jgi:hypothetical protein
LRPTKYAGYFCGLEGKEAGLTLRDDYDALFCAARTAACDAIRLRGMLVDKLFSEMMVAKG